MIAPSDIRVLIACECSGRVRDAFLARGFDAMSCDLKPSKTPGPHHQGDVLDILGDGWDLMIAHPECTYLTVTANRAFTENRARYWKRLEAMDFFFQLALCDIPAKVIENPVGCMSGVFRKPDQIIQPYEYGHNASKRTCLWLENLPTLRPTKIVPYTNFYTNPKNGKRMDAAFANATGNRAEKRSETYQGWADAMAEQWGNYLRIEI